MKKIPTFLINSDVITQGIYIKYNTYGEHIQAISLLIALKDELNIKGNKDVENYKNNSFKNTGFVGFEGYYGNNRTDIIHTNIIDSYNSVISIKELSNILTYYNSLDTNTSLFNKFDIYDGIFIKNLDENKT